jgi:hypothetical protein
MSLQNDPVFAPFFKMKKARVPMPAIKMKMQAANLDPEIIERDGTEPSPNAPAARAAAVALQDDADYAPFFKMKKARVPIPAIRMKMQAAGLNADLIEREGTSPAPNNAVTTGGNALKSVPKKKEDPGKPKCKPKVDLRVFFIFHSCCKKWDSIFFKPLFWETVKREQVEKTIWSKMDDSVFISDGAPMFTLDW